jgi:hypothetical protein
MKSKIYVCGEIFWPPPPGGYENLIFSYPGGYENFKILKWVYIDFNIPKSYKKMLLNLFIKFLSNSKIKK